MSNGPRDFTFSVLLIEQRLDRNLDRGDVGQCQQSFRLGRGLRNVGTDDEKTAIFTRVDQVRAGQQTLAGIETDP